MPGCGITGGNDMLDEQMRGGIYGTCIVAALLVPSHQLSIQASFRRAS